MEGTQVVGVAGHVAGYRGAARLLIIGFLLAVVMATRASAQVDMGTILGTIRDGSGAVLPGASVTATHDGQGLALSTTTRPDGTFVLTPVRTGAYTVRVEFPGFRTIERRGLAVGVQQQIVVDVTLEPGPVAEQVVVTAAAPLLQTGSGTARQTFGAATVSTLPLNGRDYTSLARLAPGVVPPQQGVRAPLMFSANGVRPAQNNYLLDGIDNNTSNVDFLSGVAYVVKPPVDAVDEVTILTSAFSAEYGRAGGAVLNTTLKSGTSQLRGSAWTFVRDDALNATDFFANKAGLKKGPYAGRQVGFTAGGPAVGRRTFWFADYEGSLVSQTRTMTNTVPTARQRASGFTDFSDLITLQSGNAGTDILGRTFARGTIFDPATTRRLTAGQVDPVSGLTATRAGYVRDAFAGNRIPADRLSADAVRLLMLYPEPTGAGLSGNYVVNRRATDDTHAFDLRVDHNLSARDRFFVRYSFSDNAKLRPSPFEGIADGGGFSEGDETVRVHGLAASHTHTLSSTLVNEARFGLSREHTHRVQPFGNDTSDLPGRYGILGIPQIEGNGGLPALKLSGLTQLGHDGWVVSERFSNTLQFSDNLTKVYGRHTVKTGYTYQNIDFGSTQPPYARGEYSWDGRYTSLVNATDTSTARAHFVLAQIPSIVPGGVDDLGGMHDIRVSPFGDVDAFKSYHGAYVQDSWRAATKLTVNYGLRWDWFSREQEGQAEQANFVPGRDGRPARYLMPASWRDRPLSQSFLTNLAKDGIELVYTDEYGSGLGPTPRRNFAPRVDAAYQLAEHHAIRGGYGLYYAGFENRGGNPSLAYNYPFQFTLAYTAANDVTPTRLGDGSLATLDARTRIGLDPLNLNAAGLTLRGVEFDYRTPRYHNYNATWQIELPGQHAIEAGYVGTRGRHLETFTGMNNVTTLLPPGTGQQPYVAYPDFARASLLLRTVGVSAYDALQLKVQRRYHDGLQFLVGYTLSEATTNAGDLLTGGGVGALRAPDLAGWDLANDVGRSSFHTRHALVASGAYDLPFRGAWFGGWRLNWVLSLYSGQPQTINCTPATGAGTGCYALVVGDPYAGSHDVSQFYHPAAFANPAPVAAIGQADFSPLGGRRSQVTGPPARQLDAAVARQFALWGHRKAELRLEAFNVTNTPAFNLPGSLNFNDARNFASMTSLRNTPRQLQVGLKFYW